MAANDHGSGHPVASGGSNRGGPAGRDSRDQRQASYDDVDHYYSGGWQPPAAAEGGGLMRLANRSVPHLPSQHGSDEPPPPLPTTQYDPTQVLDRFNAMHIAEPMHRGTSAMSFHTANSHPYPVDPIQRAGTSMSMQSNHSANSYAPRHANSLPFSRHPNTLPMSPAQGRPARGSSLQQVPEMTDAQSISSFHSAPSIAEEEITSPDGLAYDDPETPSRASTYSSNSQSSGYPQSRYPAPEYGGQDYGAQQQWQQGAYGEYAGYAAQGPDQYYAPASEAGMVPPQGQYPVQSYGSPYPQSQYAQSVRSFQSTASAPSMTGYPAGGAYPNRPLSDPNMGSVEEEDELVTRPSFQRAQASVMPNTAKTKAVDLTAPPYTKQYIDDFRQRIKADPDPEAHFAYAKYLVDAAKKVGADAKDQRAVKRYRETLLAEALKVIRRLATQGQPFDEAQFYLANCYGTGLLGLQVDHERAYHLYLQAAKQNHAAASYRVAVCNEIGAGTRKEPSRAAAFYRKAASLGDTAAMYKLGMILLNGSLGEAKNPRDAIGWLKRAAEQADEANPHALHELALIHDAPNNGLVPYDPMYAKRLYTQAGQLGYTHSQFKLGQAYEQGTPACPVDPRRSIAWYTKAAEKGHPEAELALSGWYLTGVEGVLKQSDSEAYLWARRAANKGLSKAEYAVGYYAEVGIGIKQDIEFAKRWYMRAAAQGNKRAMNRLTEMKRGGKRQGQARPTRQQAKDDCVIA